MNISSSSAANTLAFAAALALLAVVRVIGGIEREPSNVVSAAPRPAGDCIGHSESNESVARGMHLDMFEPGGAARRTISVATMLDPSADPIESFCRASAALLPPGG
jgi:hypothetical protein